MAARRPGDAPSSVADPTLAKELLGWVPEFGLNSMCRDHWRFQAESLGMERPAQKCAIMRKDAPMDVLRRMETTLSASGIPS